MSDELISLSFLSSEENRLIASALDIVLLFCDLPVLEQLGFDASSFNFEH